MRRIRHDRPGTDLIRVRRRLLAWYDANRRELPWRRTSDPYRIWVSEVMLQQTRVERVAGYFERFVQAFPTVGALADAPLEEVLRVWEGLGYYGRARSMHAAARVLVDAHGGELPRQPDALRALPGFGPYTSAAVASIAFGARVAAVDTNVRRVIARLGCIDGPAAAPVARAAVDRIAGELAAYARPGDVNQALMDLGAAVCQPRSPRCTDCPVAAACGAFERGDPERWPSPVARAARPRRREARAFVERGGRLLLVQRAATGRLGGYWELPGGEPGPGESPDASVQRCVESATGVRVAPAGVVATLRQSYSHVTIDVELVRCRAVGGRLRPGAGRWVTRAASAAMPLTRAARQAIALIAAP